MPVFPYASVTQCNAAFCICSSELKWRPAPKGVTDAGHGSARGLSLGLRARAGSMKLP